MHKEVLFFLFQNNFKTAFEEYITPQILINGVLFFLCITSSLVAFTYLYLGLKKKSFFFKERIKKNLELWISSVILNEDQEDQIRIPDKFVKIFRNIVARQYAIDNLITNKKAFSGTVADNIRQLYEQLGFKKDSVQKLQSNFWFVKAKGIQELAIMDQNDQLIKVYRLTNSKNELIRNEAQSAIIHWSGFNGLRFLDIASYSISEWQQIQLLVQLKTFTQQDMPKLGKWLSSKNDTVIVFALKLAEVYQQFQVKLNVEACLSHSNETIRIQAVNTLSRIGDASSADKIIEQYSNEHFTNKINILKKLPSIATIKQLPFFIRELDNENDFLKLAAARGVAELGEIKTIEDKAMLQPEPYQQIYKHVKAELEF